MQSFSAIGQHRSVCARSLKLRAFEVMFAFCMFGLEQVHKTCTRLKSVVFRYFQAFVVFCCHQYGIASQPRSQPPSPTKKKRSGACVLISVFQLVRFFFAPEIRVEVTKFNYYNKKTLRTVRCAPVFLFDVRQTRAIASSCSRAGPHAVVKLLPAPHLAPRHRFRTRKIVAPPNAP